MTRYYAFNGDADGLCALQQLRLVEEGEATLVTGVKRDIALLRHIDAQLGDEVTALDISLVQNRRDVVRILHSGASIRYFDHHRAGEVPHHRNLEIHIDEAADVCTSVIVDQYLGGCHRSWAIVAAFGDGLRELGTAMAKKAGFDRDSTETLDRLGVCLNYNAYGETISDLIFHPADLAREMLSFRESLDFARQSEHYVRLREQFENDIQLARKIRPAHQVPGATVVELPNEPWARRVIGVLANEIWHTQPDYAVAILSPNASGGFTVSVRVPTHHAIDAADFCRNFETGGGRRHAAGINHLPRSDLDQFAASFDQHFRSR